MIRCVTPSRSRTKLRVFIIICLIQVPIIFNIFSRKIQGRLTLQKNVVNFQKDLQLLNFKYSQERIQLLSRQLVLLPKNKYSPPNFQFYRNNSMPNIKSIQFPSIYKVLPHLLNDPNSLKPAFIQSKGRSGVSMILGVPTVKREVQTYLLNTLKNLIECMTPDESADTLIIVLVAEPDVEYVSYVAKQIEVHFPEEHKIGLIDIISPAASYYPDFSKLRHTLGDNHQRVVWRSKQNLDFAFLMFYAQKKGTFYVQLEDDILTKRNFISTMKSFALEKVNAKENWFVLDFCQLGFIGKLFKCSQLPFLVHFFLISYNEKPIDWLLGDLISVMSCSFIKNAKQCKRAKMHIWVHYTPSLFQHTGTYSSLKGKVQKLKDKLFGKITLFYSHVNPDATIETQIKPYKQYTLQKAYKGETFFWGLLPQPGDHLKFKFSHPVFIKKYLFRSGNPEHPLDKFYNTTVEVLPESQIALNRNYSNVTEDGYIIVGRFDSLGIATGPIDKKLGKLSALRLTVHSESENWVILSEIEIQEDSS